MHTVTVIAELFIDMYAINRLQSGFRNEEMNEETVRREL